MSQLPDPRRYPEAHAAPRFAAALHALAAQSLAAASGQAADAHDADLRARLGEIVARGDGDALAALLATTPSVDVHRHLWRLLARLAGEGRGDGDGLAVTLFALPIIVIVAPTGARMRLPGVLPDVAALVGVLRDHGALSGNQSFGLGNALVHAQAIDVPRWPALLASRSLAKRHVPLALPPAPIDAEPGERAHLRFLVGSALAADSADLLHDGAVGAWARPLATALTSQLASPGATLVTLPRPPMSLPAALAHGRAAQREVSAQLFASSALRAARASTGEPVAVVSAHEAADAPGGGELRLSLSSPFAPREAQGFRCPLYPNERVADVAAMLVELLGDCRVADVRLLSGVHRDRDPVTGGPLLFKPGTIPPSAVVN